MQSAAIDVEGAARQLTDGEGYVLFERFFDDELFAEARALLWRRAEQDQARPPSGEAEAVADAGSVLPMLAAWIVPIKPTPNRQNATITPPPPRPALRLPRDYPARP